MDRDYFDPLMRVVTALGSQTAVARVCEQASGRKIKQAHVWNWLFRDKRCPPEFGIPLEVETMKVGKPVSRKELCPGVFDEVA